MSEVLVTGGAGFIGSNLTEALLKQGHRVRVLDNFSTGKRENLAFDEAYPCFEIIEGDIRDLTICQRATIDIEYVFHKAAFPSVQRSVEDPLTSNSEMGNKMGTLVQMQLHPISPK
jgi:UDP-N-acetylglucosamine 4-epimerase